MKRLFVDLDPTSRLQMLKDNCIATKKHSYSKPYSHDELLAMQQELIDLMMEHQRRKAEFELVRAEYREEMKRIDRDIIANMSGLRDKARTVDEECFIIANLEEGVAEYCNHEGEIVYTRPLEPSERQANLPNITTMTGTTGK